MSASMSHAANAEPNLTPILDMVFQLITFFMLVINFQAASVDLSLKLPVVGTARPVDTGGNEELLVLNIDAEGNLNAYGQKRDVATYLAAEAQTARALLAAKNPDEASATNELPTMVVIRADRQTPFRLLNRVITSCQKNGFLRFALKAMTKES